MHVHARAHTHTHVRAHTCSHTHMHTPPPHTHTQASGKLTSDGDGRTGGKDAKRLWDEQLKIKRKGRFWVKTWETPVHHVAALLGDQLKCQARMMAALSCSTVPKITIIVGNAVGPVHYLMVSYALLILGGIFMVVICSFRFHFFVSFFSIRLVVLYVYFIYWLCLLCVCCVYGVCVRIVFVCEWCIVICTALLLLFYFACFIASGLTDW